MKKRQLLILLLTPIITFCGSCSANYIAPHYDDPLLALNKVEVDFSFLNNTKDLYIEGFYNKQNITYTSSSLGFNYEVIFKSFLKESTFYIVKGGPGGYPVSQDLLFVKYTFTTSNDLSFYLFTLLKNKNEINTEKRKMVVYKDSNFSYQEGYYLWVGGNGWKLKDEYKPFEQDNASYIRYIQFKNEKRFNDFVDFLKETSFIN